MVSMRRMSSSRATIAAGTSPPRVTATMPANGPSPATRHASARQSRWISSQLTGKFLIAVGSAPPPFTPLRCSADVELDLVALHAGAGGRRERHALGRKPHAGERAQYILGIALGGVGMERHLRGIAGVGRHGDEIEGGVRAPFQRAANRSIERLLIGHVRTIE